MKPSQNNIFSWKKEGDDLVIQNLDHSNAASIPIQKPFMWRFMANDYEGTNHLHPIFRVTIFMNSSMRVFIYEYELAWALYYWATQFAEKYSWGTLGITKIGVVLYDHEPEVTLIPKAAQSPKAKIRLFFTNGKQKIDAIKLLRNLSDTSLKEAKDFCDQAFRTLTVIPDNWYKITKQSDFLRLMKNSNLACEIKYEG